MLEDWFDFEELSKIYNTLSPSVSTFTCAERSSYGQSSIRLFSWTPVLVSVYIHGGNSSIDRIMWSPL